MKIEDIIVERIRGMLDAPDSSLEKMRLAQIKLGKNKELIDQSEEVFQYVVSCQVAMLFWVLAEMGFYEDKNYKKGDWKKPPEKVQLR